MRKESKTGRFVSGKGFVVSAKGAAKRNRAGSFYQGFVDGVGSPVTVAEAVSRSPRKYEGRGVKGDWAAVGYSIRRVLPDT